MADAKSTPFYNGLGKPAGPDKWQNLPSYNPEALTHPRGYQAPPGLVAAVNVALELGMPLLLTGEPGCGKSQLAYSLAWELGYPYQEDAEFLKPLCFTVKSDTQSRDIFYNFDTLGRFRASDNSNPHQYLRFEALGLAILHALGPEAIKKMGLASCFEQLPLKAQRSVVLIDEIDKAPREVPNDILNEIDRMSFDIPELFETGKGRKIVALPKATTESPQVFRPVVIITSNLERDLPEAFLRRCVYFHVDLPPFRHSKLNGTSGSTAQTDKTAKADEVTIESIVEKRLNIRIEFKDKQANSKQTVWAGSIALFSHLRSREVTLQKKPSTAELLNWLQLLHTRLQAVSAPLLADHAELFKHSAKVCLFKHKKDQDAAEQLINSWLAKPAT